MLGEVLKSDMPTIVLVIGVFLLFTLQLIKIGIDTVGKAREHKGNRNSHGDTVNHLAIYEKLGEHHAVLLAVQQDVKATRESVRKLENDFRLHTQSDTHIAELFIERLNHIDQQVLAISVSGSPL